ncbi:hypothetical protein [Planococcus versutus]|uniref:hypothetical protein n=1 Tax=Planococcus versutus TaxID=1302659 RepID=UPI001EF7520D|nr:hypothetical protein [Planococcus versutus]
MTGFKLAIYQDTLEIQKRYHNRKIHIEKKMEEIPKQYEAIFGDTRTIAAAQVK